MNCPLQNPVNPDILLDYCSRKLSEKSLLMFEQHAGACSGCRRFVVEQKAVSRALDHWDAEPISSGFDRKLYARIEEHERGGWWKRAWARTAAPFRWRPFLPAAAACATFALALSLYQPGFIPVPVMKESTRLEALEAEQVERTLEDLEMLTQLASPANSQSL